MKEIPLTHGYSAQVDDEDFEFLNQWKWRVSRVNGPGGVYAVRWSSRKNPPRKQIFMHKLLLQADGESYGDHIDSNRLNNQKHNLRPATNSQNLANRGPTKLNRSGFKGVAWNRQRRKWCAYVKCNGSGRYLGGFENKQDAAKAYDHAAITAFGQFAKTNQSMGLI